MTKYYLIQIMNSCNTKIFYASENLLPWTNYSLPLTCGMNMERQEKNLT